MAIGICDWGIGGLGFYNLLRAERPDLDVVYIGDQGVPGYGKFDRKSLKCRIEMVFRTFESCGVSEAVVACNAASTVVGDVHVQGVRGHGIILPTLDAMSHLPKGAVGLIGGRRTIRSGVYRRALQIQGWTVRQRVAQPLSQMIEDGEAGTPETQKLLAQIVSPLGGVDYLVLACTHYIVLEANVRRLLPGTAIIDPATEAWDRVKGQLPPTENHVGRTRFLTTGSAAAMQLQAKIAFGVDAAVEEITI